MFPVELKYTETHEWAKMEDAADIVIIGITDYAVKQLGDIVFLELPKTGDKVKKGYSFAVIESIKAVFSLNSPVTGEVIEANQHLADNLELLNTDLYEHGWMIKIKIENKNELESLMDASAYESFLKEKEGEH